MIRKILAYVKEYKAASIATPCFMILEVIMEMVIPLLMASIIDHGVNEGNMTVSMLREEAISESYSSSEA